MAQAASSSVAAAAAMEMAKTTASHPAAGPLSTAAASTARSTVSSPARPHIVAILQDDLGYNDAAFTGGKPYIGRASQHISALAKEGIVLTRHCALPRPQHAPPRLARRR